MCSSAGAWSLQQERLICEPSFQNNGCFRVQTVELDVCCRCRSSGISASSSSSSTAALTGTCGAVQRSSSASVRVSGLCLFRACLVCLESPRCPKARDTTRSQPLKQIGSACERMATPAVRTLCHGVWLRRIAQGLRPM